MLFFPKNRLSLKTTTSEKVPYQGRSKKILYHTSMSWLHKIVVLIVEHKIINIIKIIKIIKIIN